MLGCSRTYIASQRTDHGIPCALACRALGVPLSMFYAQLNHTPSPARCRRDGTDAAVAESFLGRDIRVAESAGGGRSATRPVSCWTGGTYGSLRVLADLRAEGWLQARRDVAAWIDQWYNRRRRHSSADMLPPIEYEFANAA